LQYEGVTLEDVHRARCTVEPALAGILAARKDPDAISQLRQLLDQEEACLNDHIAYAHASVRFHERMADLAGVQTLAMCVRQFNWVLERFFVGQRQPQARNALSHRAHAHFLNLLEHASPRDVEEYWRTHCDAVGEFMLKGHEGERVLDLFS
jgi:DNA-binding FadR family transcriptional regulator